MLITTPQTLTWTALGVVWAADASRDGVEQGRGINKIRDNKEFELSLRFELSRFHYITIRILVFCYLIFIIFFSFDYNAHTTVQSKVKTFFLHILLLYASSLCYHRVRTNFTLLNIFIICDKKFSFHISKTVHI